MGCISIKTIGIHDRAVRTKVKVEDKVLNTLELWGRWNSSVATEMVDGIHKIRQGIFHYIEEFYNMCTKFS